MYFGLQERFNSPTSSLGLDIKIVTDMVTEPVSLVEMKNYLRVDYSLDDDLITMLIKSARQALELYTTCSFGSKNIIATYNSIARIIEIPYGPIGTINGIKTVNSDGTEITLTTDDYNLSGELFKKLELNTTGGVIIDYNAGYTVLPSDLKLAIMQQVAFMYENRGDTTGGLTTAAQKLARQYMRNPFSI